MARRKKLQHKVHSNKQIGRKIATLGLAPLVAVSPFLFAGSSMAAVEANRAPIAHPVPGILLNVYKAEWISFSSLFTDPDGDPLTYEIIDTNAGEIAAFSSHLDGLSVYGYNIGTKTFTIKATDGAGAFATLPLTVRVTHDGLITEELDADGDGLDISDVLKAWNDPVKGDLNRDGVRDRWDISSMLGFIQPKMNHNPIFAEGVTKLPDREIPNAGIKFYTDEFFTDPDGDRLYYTVLSSNPDIHANWGGESFDFIELSAGPEPESPTSTITVIAQDNRGGFKVARFTATATSKHVPDITDAHLLYEPHMNQGNILRGTVEGVFQDEDGDELTYTISSDDPNVASATMINGKRFEIKATGYGYAWITVTASDGTFSKSHTFHLTVERGLGLPTRYNPEDYPVINLDHIFEDTFLYDVYHYTVSSSNSDVGASLSSSSMSSLFLQSLSPGATEATITVTADLVDPNRENKLTNFESLEYQIYATANQAPATVSSAVYDYVVVGGTQLDIDMSSMFHDVDDAVLTYEAKSYLDYSVSGNHLFVTAPVYGYPYSTVTVAASDSYGPTEALFTVWTANTSSSSWPSVINLHDFFDWSYGSFVLVDSDTSHATINTDDLGSGLLSISGSSQGTLTFTIEGTNNSGTKYTKFIIDIPDTGTSS